MSRKGVSNSSLQLSVQCNYNLGRYVHIYPSLSLVNRYLLSTSVPGGAGFSSASSYPAAVECVVLLTIPVVIGIVLYISAYYIM